jgi:F-type H+-transporting ATPase subunit delta
LITNAIARRYAKALIELATEEEAVEKYYGELTDFESILAACPEGSAVFSSPAFTFGAKKKLLEEIVGSLPISGTVSNFLFVLLQNNRLDQLSQIISGYRAFADELSGVLRGTVTCALPLEEAQLSELRTTIEKSTGKKVLLGVELDPSLIGGVVARVGDKIFDGSIRTQLDRIQDILQKG